VRTKYDLIANICHDSLTEQGMSKKSSGEVDDPLSSGSYRVHVRNDCTGQVRGQLFTTTTTTTAAAATCCYHCCCCCLLLLLPACCCLLLLLLLLLLPLLLLLLPVAACLPSSVHQLD
jgi:hypothetical protein